MRVLLISALLSVAFAAQSQYGSSFWDKVYFSPGDVSLSAGSQFTSFGLSPLVGYKFTDRLSAGVSVTYQFNNYKTIDAKLTHYGGGIFGRFMITQQFFATTQYEHLSIEVPLTADFKRTTREGFDSWFVGGGFVQPLGGKVTFTIIGLYNLLYDDMGNSPYDSPFVVRGGINVGF